MSWCNKTLGFLFGCLGKRITIIRWKLSLLSFVFLFLGTAAGMYLILSGAIKTIFASDTASTWDFSVAGNYTLSDAGDIEVSGNTARLKVWNYTSDVNTVALYHLDESLGSGTATDSATSANHATVTSSTFGAAKFNNGLTLDSSTSFVSAPDTSATSLTGSFTIEAWTKFSSGFSATTDRNNQGILDKGVYQMYYDHQTGKVVFEITPNSANSWEQVAGPDLLNSTGISTNRETKQSWDNRSKNLMWRQVVVGSDIYVALGSGTSGTTVTGDAEVWKCTDCATAPVWSKIGGDGVNSSWIDGVYEDTSALTTDGTNIYAGLGNTPGGEGEVWRFNGTSWTQIGGDGLNSSWTTAGSYERVTNMVASGTTIYASLGLSAGDAEIWKCVSCDGGSPIWSKVGGDGSGTAGQSWSTSTYEDVPALTLVGTILAVGLGTSAGDGELWTCDTAGTCSVTAGWTKRGGDATGSGGQSWNNTIEEVRSITSSGTVVFVGLGSTVSSGVHGDAEVWSCDLAATCTTTAGWTKVGGDGLNSGWADMTYERVWSLLASGTTVYAGLGDTIGGDAELWKCTNCTTTPVWSKLGGDGTGVPPQSWGSQSGASFGYATTLSLIGNNLFVGASTSSGNAETELWRCDISGTCSDTLGWTRVGGRYLNGSWGILNLASVESMVTVGNKLYAGTGYNGGTAFNGNALVWEYNGTSWTRIGGQGLNGSWAYGHPSVSTVTYRSVTSMTGYNGTLVVGLGGGSNGDAEVWSWNGTIWTKIGGDGTGAGGQSWASGTKLSVPAMTMLGTRLYAGLQGSSAGDGELWTCDLAATCTTTAGWTLVGGDATGAGGQSWANSVFEAIWSLTTRGTSLYVGLGTSTLDAEVWSCNTGATCTQTAGWTKLGGDGVNSSWNTSYEEVTALSWYRNELYAGLGASTGDAELWKWNGTSWGGVAIAGDGLNGSWANDTYERVKSLVSFNGDLIVGTGDTTGHGEVWKYDTATWTRIGGANLNDGWTGVMERIPALAVYQGKLYAGTGLTANSDATIWAYGGNVRLQSTATSQDTSWHHLAVTYNGSTLKMYIDGVESASQATSAVLSDTVHPLVLGGLAGAQYVGGASARLNGQIDEVRVSNIVRSSFHLTQYPTVRATVQPSTAVHTSGIFSWDTLTPSETLNGGTITYRISGDGGATWWYWNGSAWATSVDVTQASTGATISTHLSTFPVTTGGFLWQAIFLGDGTQRVTLNSVVLDATSDLVAPVAPSSVTAFDQLGGVVPLTTDTWYAHAAPSFSWSGASDAASGLAGYYVYFGTDDTADPETAPGSFQVGTTYTAGALVSGSTYYLRVKAKDNAQNKSTIYAAFIYKFDTVGPNNPASVAASPAVYSSTNDYTFLWMPGTDTSSGIAGYQYQVGASINPASWSTTVPGTSLNLPGAAYTPGENILYLRTIDNAGNLSSGVVQVSYYYAGNGPSAPRFLLASPSTSTTNSFIFDWEPPEVYSSDPVDNPSELTYCYTVNSLPTEDNCTFTAPGVTTIGPNSFATQVGINTFYVVAKNGEDVGGVVSYGNTASIFFTANTAAPGIPTNVEIADVSVKNTSSWKLAVSWEAPTDIGSGVNEYEIYRSTNNSNFTKVASTSGIAYVDTGLDQQVYYFKVRACDNVHNCGAFSTAVSMLPTGRFTSPAELSADPKVLDITTKNATISWSTNRTSDTKVQYGKSARSYLNEEPSNSDQVTEHIISLSNLSPGTKYFYKAKWTDEDGNTGTSNEDSFETAPAPTVTDPKIKSIGLTSVVLEFTVQDASKARIYYGTTTAFGSVKEIATSINETTYNVTLDNLTDGTKYYYKINTLDTEEEEYDGSTLSFETLPRPKISQVRLQQVRGTAQTVMLITWETNTETSSIVTFYPEGAPTEARDEVNIRLQKGEHKILIKDLQAQTSYSLIVKGRDKAGNEAVSEIQKFTTATDTRPPQVLDVNVEGTVTTKGSGADQQSEAQVVVSWNTDEAATSQVEYGEGTGTSYAQKTQEDSSWVSNHTVVISGLSPSRVYHLRIVSKDKANNEGHSIDIVTITPKATASALDLVVTSLRSIFGT